MKKTIALSILALVGCMHLMAAPVTQQRAGDIALAYVSQQKGASSSLKISTVNQINDGVYLVNFAPKGFALISADDNTTPIIGFSTTGNLNATNIPDNMAFYIKEAGDIVNLQATRGNVNHLWKNIEEGSFVMSRSSSEPVENLIKVNWNQGSPYNKYCPGEDKTKAMVGCVAVAMSQAMSVQQYPAKPMGYVGYVAPNYGQLSIDFDAEEPYDWATMLADSKGKNDEVSRLLYHAGLAVNMEYGADGSGIPSNQVYRITKALRDNFGYDSDVAYYWRKNYHEDWTELLLNELYAGHALVYNAIDTKGGYGHSFNIDGYNGALFHVNWGWGGYGDGFFSIDALQDAQMGMNYDSSHVVVTGIGAANSALRGINLPDRSVEEKCPAGTTVSALLVNGELPTSNMNITITGEYTGNGYAKAPFAYENGQIVTTRELTVAESPVYLRVQVTLKDDTSVKLSQGFSIEVETPQSIESKTSVSYDRGSRMFTVHTKYNASYSVKNSQGAVIVNGNVSTLPEFQFSRDQLTEGTNVMEITVGGATYSVNIVK